MNRYFPRLFAYLLMALLALPAFAQNRSAEIRTLLEARDRDVKAVIGNRTTFTAQQREQLKTLINGIIDFEAMGQQALGASWNTLTPAQRTEFVRVFSEIVRNQSLADLNIYRARVNYGDINVTGNTALAHTTTVQGGKTIKVDYRMALRNGQWRITDIVLDNVSTAGGYARSFQQVIRRRGFDGLMQTLNRRLQSQRS